MKNRNLRLSPVRVIALSFMGVILLGTLLLSLPCATVDGSISLLDALFTATSATCVTGLVIYDTFTKFTLFGRIVILLMIQVGGLGLVTFATFFNILLGRRMHFSGIQLANENSGFGTGAQTAQLIRLVIFLTFATEFIGFGLLAADFVPRYGSAGWGYSIFTAVSAYCNAGFDLFGFQGPFSSLTGFVHNPYVLLVVAGLITSGGLGFLVWSEVFNYRKTKRLSLHSKLVLRVSLALVLCGGIAFAALEWNNPRTLGELPLFDKLTNSLFQSVTLRTAGFNSIDLSACDGLTKLIMSGLMFIGAAPGGTGGGVKVTTVSVLMITVYSVMRGREEASMFNRRIEKTAVYRSLAVVTLGILVVGMTVPFLFYGSAASVTIIDCLFESVSAFGTVGLSVGVTSLMLPIAKLVTIFVMLIGRLGPVTFAYFFAREQHRPHGEVLPESKILVG